MFDVSSPLAAPFSVNSATDFNIASTPELPSTAIAGPNVSFDLGTKIQLGADLVREIQPKIDTYATLNTLNLADITSDIGRIEDFTAANSKLLRSDPLGQRVLSNLSQQNTQLQNIIDASLSTGAAALGESAPPVSKANAAGVRFDLDSFGVDLPPDPLAGAKISEGFPVPVSIKEGFSTNTTTTIPVAKGLSVSATESNTTLGVPGARGLPGPDTTGTAMTGVKVTGTLDLIPDLLQGSATLGFENRTSAGLSTTEQYAAAQVGLTITPTNKTSFGVSATHKQTVTPPGSGVSVFGDQSVKFTAKQQLTEGLSITGNATLRNRDIEALTSGDLSNRTTATVGGGLNIGPYTIGYNNTDDKVFTGAGTLPGFFDGEGASVSGPLLGGKFEIRAGFEAGLATEKEPVGYFVSGAVKFPL